MSEPAILPVRPGSITHSEAPARHRTWEIREGVTCAVCPDCAFTFDAVHMDDGKDAAYSCPNCAEHVLRQRYEEAIEALRDLEAELAKEYPNGPWEDGDDPWDRAWVAARTALAHYREATNGAD